MRRELELVYERCLLENKVHKKEDVDIGKIHSLIESANNETQLAGKIEKLSANTASHLFKTYYDIFREVCEAYLLFERISITNHVCLFAHMALKHPELEFSWNKLESIRKTRNKICYYGTQLEEKEWNKHKILMKLYINSLKMKVEKKINEFG